MNARHAARELALLTLFQMDRQDADAVNPVAIRRQDIQDLILSSVRALSAEAESQIRTAAQDLAEVSRYLISHELDHPDNLNTPLEAEVKPVPIPTTREMVEKIEQCLQAAEFLHEALRIPELLALAGQEEVQTYAFQLISLVAEHKSTLDELLNRHMTDWRMDRLVRMDRYILRLAAAEMRHVQGVDLGVSINEAVELAKRFSSEESYRLINGILGGAAGEIAGDTGKTLLNVSRGESPVTG